MTETSLFKVPLRNLLGSSKLRPKAQVLNLWLQILDENFGHQGDSRLFELNSTVSASTSVATEIHATPHPASVSPGFRFFDGKCLKLSLTGGLLSFELEIETYQLPNKVRIRR